MITFLAPAPICFDALALSMKMPVLSMTTVYAQFAPRQLSRIALGKRSDFYSIHDQRSHQQPLPCPDIRRNWNHNGIDAPSYSNHPDR